MLSRCSEKAVPARTRFTVLQDLWCYEDVPLCNTSLYTHCDCESTVGSLSCPVHGLVNVAPPHRGEVQTTGSQALSAG